MDIRSDMGAFVGTLLPEAWEVLFPINISPQEFLTLKKRLGGFGEASKSFSLDSILSSSSPLSPSGGPSGPSGGGVSGGVSGGTRDAAFAEIELILRVKKMLNVFLVQGAGVGELLFAGCSRKGMMEEKVLITVTSDR